MTHTPALFRAKMGFFRFDFVRIGAFAPTRHWRPGISLLSLAPALYCKGRGLVSSRAIHRGPSEPARSLMHRACAAKLLRTRTEYETSTEKSPSSTRSFPSRATENVCTRFLMRRICADWLAAKAPDWVVSGRMELLWRTFPSVESLAAPYPLIWTQYRSVEAVAPHRGSRGVLGDPGHSFLSAPNRICGRCFQLHLWLRKGIISRRNGMSNLMLWSRRGTVTSAAFAGSWKNNAMRAKRTRQVTACMRGAPT